MNDPLDLAEWLLDLARRGTPTTPADIDLAYQLALQVLAARPRLG